MIKVSERNRASAPGTVPAALFTRSSCVIRDLGAPSPTRGSRFARTGSSRGVQMPYPVPEGGQ